MFINVLGPIGSPETTVNIYEPTQRENPKDPKTSATPRLNPETSHGLIWLLE
jgi:hypothetical protein